MVDGSMSAVIESIAPFSVGVYATPATWPGHHPAFIRRAFPSSGSAVKKSPDHRIDVTLRS
jgi:hypothetical protein